MFQNMQHCRDFAKLDVLPDLISLLDLSCMPLVTPSTAAFSSISALFRMLSEVKPVEVAKAIVQAVRGSLDQTTWFWEGFSPESRLLAAVSPREYMITHESLFTTNLRTSIHTQPLAKQRRRTIDSDLSQFFSHLRLYCPTFTAT